MNGKNTLTLIVALCLMMLTASISTAQTPTVDLGSIAQNYPEASEAEQEVVRLTNELRTGLGLGTVRINACLTLSARRHSEDMGVRNYFNHTAPEPAPYGAKFSQRAQAAGYPGSPQGENIAAGYRSAQSVYDGWEASQGHYNNMVRESINEIGVGLVIVDGSDYGHYWTMVTGRGDTPCAVRTYAPTQITVGGNLTDYPASPTFTWTHNDATPETGKATAEWYRLHVMNNGTTVMDEWAPVNTFQNYAAACTGSACSFSSAANWSAGTYEVWMSAWSEAGGVVEVSQGETFNIETGPALPQMVTPAGSASVTAAEFELVWNQDVEAEWYHVVLVGPSGVVLDRWVQDTNGLCANGTCSLPVSVLANGAYSWWMTAWGPGGFAVGGEYSGYISRNFTVNVPRPGNVGGRTPANQSTTATGATDLSWAHEDGALWYHIYLMGPSGYLLDQWYEAATVCEGTTCTVNGESLSAGSYSWWMVAWGPAGFSSGGYEGSGYTESTFTAE